MTVPVDPIAVALAVTRALDALGIIHTIGGSIASSIAGEPPIDNRHRPLFAILQIAMLPVRQTKEPYSVW